MFNECIISEPGNKAFVSLILITSCLMCILAVTLTIALLVCKSRHIRPVFVTCKVIFFDLRCLCFVIYFLFYFDRIYNPNHIAIVNAVATLGDALELLEDWVVTEQYISANLNMQIIIRQLKGSADGEIFAERKRQTRLKVKIFSVIFYSGIVMYAIMSFMVDKLWFRLLSGTLQLY